MAGKAGFWPKKPAPFRPEAGSFWPEKSRLSAKSKPALAGKAGLHRPGVGRGGLEGRPFQYVTSSSRGVPPREDSAPGRAKKRGRHGEEPAEAGRSRLLSGQERAGFCALFRQKPAPFPAGKEPASTEAPVGASFPARTDLNAALALPAGSGTFMLFFGRKEPAQTEVPGRLNLSNRPKVTKRCLFWSLL